MSWPDVVIVGLAAIATLKGFKRGFVAELAGVIALAAGCAAAYLYRGEIDDLVAHTVHVGPGSAHVIAMVVVGLAVYAIALVASFLLTPIVKIPGINLLNGVFGAAVGAAKGIFFVWVIVYVALFFPLSRDLHDDLRHSDLVRMIATPNEQVDAVIRSTLPWFVKPFAEPLFQRHRL